MSGRASCNICGEETFGDTYGPSDSTGVRFVCCGSPECHWLLLELLTIKDLLSGMRKVLHLAPGACPPDSLRARPMSRKAAGPA
jgi:hypothetical protein